MTARSFKPGGLRAGLSMLLTGAMALASATAVLAAEGNSNYLGILSSTAPTGYTPSPNVYSLAQGQNTLSFNLQVTNITSETQAMTLELDLDHIITYNGQNVADGQPGVVNGAVVDGQFSETASTQVKDPNPTLFPISIGPNATQTLTFTRTLAAATCGYFQVDVAKQGLTSQKGLSGLEIRVLGCGTPDISTTASPTTGSVGDQIMDTATLTGGIIPTGTVSFSLYGPGDSGCTTDLVAANSAFQNITLSGGSASSPSFTTAQAGTYNWIARYNGDVNNNAVASACGAEQVVIAPVTPGISTTASPSSVIVGAPIHDSATVSGGFSPTGTVTFKLFGPGDTTCATNLVSGAGFVNVPLSGGSATSGNYTTGAAGTYRWIATYNGDVNNNPVSSGCQDEQVAASAASPSIRTTASPTSATVGALIHDSATVSGGFNPTGTVTFKLFGPGDTTCATNLVSGAGFVNVPLSGGSATSGNYATSAVGTYRWIATYNGDSNNNPASSGCQDELVTTSAASPGISTTASPASATVGALIHDSATVSGGFNPTGTVTFKLFGPGDTTCTTNLVSGAGFDSVSLSGGSATSGNYATSAVGTYRWIASYSGDSNNNPVSSGCQDEQVVTHQATPSINTTPVPATGAVGTAISDTASVTGGFNPTGTVTFKLFGPADTTCSGSSLVSGAGFNNVPLSGGSATSGSYVTTAAGIYNWTAAYSGDANNAAVSSGCNAEQVDITKPLGGQGCTPGFWKNPKHYPLWTGITPTQLVGSLFTIQATFADGSSGSALANSTMAQGLAFQGGSTLNGASQILLRAAIAGVLNANNPNVSYSMTAAQIVSSVNAALASNDRNTIVNLAAQIDSANNGQQGCPLS